MAGLADFRKEHPEYGNVADRELSDALHAKYYSQIPKAEFDAKMGLQGPPTVLNNSFTTGIAEGVEPGGDIVGGFGDVLNAGMKGAGIQTRDTSKPLPTVNGNLPTLQNYLPGMIEGKNYQPESTAGEFARTIGSFIPGAGAGPAGVGRKVASVVIPAVTSEALGQVTKGSKAEPYVRALGAFGGAAAANPIVSGGKYLVNALKGIKPQDAVDAIAPTWQKLKAAAVADYDFLKTPEGNPIIHRDAQQPLKDKVREILTEHTYDPTEDPLVRRLWERINTLPDSHTTWQGLEGLRQHAVKVGQNFTNAPSQALMGNKIKAAITQHMADLDESHIIGTEAGGVHPAPGAAPGAVPSGPGSLGGPAPGPTASGTVGGPIPITDAASGATVINPKGAAGAATAAAPSATADQLAASQAAIVRARKAWSVSKKAKAIEAVMDAADLRGSANYSQGGADLATRRGFTNLALNPKKMAQFSPEEQDAIRLVSKGGAIPNILRHVGKFAVRGPVSAGATSLIGHAFGPAGPYVLGAVGEAGRAASASATQSNVQALEALVRGGPAAQRALTAAQQKRLAEALKMFGPSAIASGEIMNNPGATAQQ